MPCLSSGCHVSHSSSLPGFCWFGSKATLCAAFVYEQQNFLKKTFVAREVEVCSNVLQL